MAITPMATHMAKEPTSGLTAPRMKESSALGTVKAKDVSPHLQVLSILDSLNSNTLKVFVS